MPHVVYLERADHLEVISEHSGSRVIAAMNETQWQGYWATSPDMAAYRASQPSAVAAILPVGMGRWLKDLSARFVPPPTQEEQDAETNRQRLLALATRLEDDTATTAETREAVARLIRRMVR